MRMGVLPRCWSWARTAPVAGRLGGCLPVSSGRLCKHTRAIHSSPRRAAAAPLAAGVVKVIGTGFAKTFAKSVFARRLAFAYRQRVKRKLKGMTEEERAAYYGKRRRYATGLFATVAAGTIATYAMNLETIEISGRTRFLLTSP